jgi:23S rRNA-/tRNA-specific pseudouridylate synthase
MEKIATTYFPLTKGTWKGKVDALIMCDDDKQLQPKVVAEGGQNAVNEFRHQIEFLLFERLRRHGFSANHLMECH